MMMSRGVRVGALSQLGCAILLAGSVAACGGSSAPADSPEAEPARESSEPEEPADPSAESEASASAETAPAPAAEPAASEPVSVQTFSNALQAVIGDPAVLEAIGHDPNSTKPVPISGKDLPAGLERAAMIRHVEVVPLTDKPSKRAVLLFTRITLDDKNGTFKYRCEATHAFGTTRVAYEGGSWQLKASQISTQ